jgi:glycosyltransferase involved in cell wall biosynthesis
MTPESPRISVVVPCYRSKATIGSLVARLKGALRDDFEVILVNDASPDDTWAEIERLASVHPCVRGIDLMVNAGQFRATLCGLHHSRGQIVCTMDDDLQHPPEELPKLIDRLDKKADLDCVVGAYQGKQHGWFRNWGSRVYARLANKLYGKPLKLEMTSFRAMRKPLAEVLNRHGSARLMLEVLILRSTRRIENVSVEHHPRAAGRSGYNIAKLAKLFVQNVVATSSLPLQILGGVGALSSGLAITVGLVALVARLAGASLLSGAGATILAISFFGGLSLVGIGLIGEYLMRLIDEKTGAPRFTVRHQTAVATPTRPRIEAAAAANNNYRTPEPALRG